MKIVSWEKYDTEKYPGMEPPESWEAEQITIEEIKKHGYLFNGFYHQNGEHGCPVFDNGKQFVASLRVWGGIMQEAHPELIDSKDDMGYCLLAWNLYDEYFKDKYKYPK